MKWWRVRKVANAATWQMMMFTTGILAGVMLIALMPGMPWAVIIADDPNNAVLAGQRSATAAAWWGVSVSVVSSLVGAAGLWLIYRTLKESQRSADAAHLAVQAQHAGTAVSERIGHAQVRAYLTVREVTLTLGPGSILIQVEFSNEGQSPARNVTFRLDTKTPRHRENILRGYHFEPERRTAVRLGEVDTISFATMFEPPRPGDHVEALIYVEVEYDDVFRGYEDDKQAYGFINPSGMKLMQTYRMRRIGDFMD